ncbi:MAG: hypothetical protein E7L17_04350 [Clostridium sp.]|uniref:hypothetical protein n=1 Tax=Clostridium sp. TaxID=1506 RepID=UPI002908BB7D|nr:hypothetical protein [Clostridium sp.]MDU7337326.1 hypothetical protein [Clostridium sp.]
MLTQEFLVCLEQKKILMEQILNITKQMEVQTLEESLELDGLLEQRGLLMQRVDKCNVLIQSKIELCSPDEQERLRSLVAAQLEEDSCSQDEQKALILVKDINAMFRQAAALNRSTLDFLFAQRENTKNRLAELKQQGEQNTLFTYQ